MVTPETVYFTGLAVTTSNLGPRIHYGVIPPDWQRCRFVSAAGLSVFNQWLTENIDGRWAITTAFRQRQREVTIAFEHAFECSFFILNDGVRLGADANDI